MEDNFSQTCFVLITDALCHFKKEEVRAVDENEIRVRFETVYDKTYEYIYRFLLTKISTRETAEDILQSVYLRFYDKLKSGSRILDAKHYLLRSAKNAVADYYKMNRQHESIDEHVTIVDEKALRRMENDDTFTYEEILESLRRMDDVTYRIFMLHYVHDYTIEKTAEIVGMSISTVKSRMYRTIKKLQNEIKEGESDALFRRNKKIR